MRLHNGKSIIQFTVRPHLDSAKRSGLTQTNARSWWQGKDYDRPATGQPSGQEQIHVSWRLCDGLLENRDQNRGDAARVQ